MSGEEPAITLVSSDGESFRIPVRVAKYIGLVSERPEDDLSDFPVEEVKAAILAKVIEFLKHHADAPLPEIEKPLRSKKMEELVPAWYAAFVDTTEVEQLYELVLAANYCECKPLLELACAKVGTMMIGKSTEEIRSIFKINNDFTPEEEQQVIEENKLISEA